MRCGTIGRTFSLLRQGIELGIEYGPRSVGSLVRVAETIEESVYGPGSLERDGSTVRFVLLNPPLRTGAFAAIRLRWNGAAVPPEAVRYRTPGGGGWRPASTISPDAPLPLRAGRPLQVEAVVGDAGPGSDATVRLEFDCPAIPPLVWLEFRDTVRSS